MLRSLEFQWAALARLASRRSQPMVDWPCSLCSRIPRGGDRRRRRFLRTAVCAERIRQPPDFVRFAEQQRSRARRASGPLRAQVGTRLTRQSIAPENRTKSGGNSARQLASIPSRRSPPLCGLLPPTYQVCRVVCTAFENASRSVATPYHCSTTYCSDRLTDLEALIGCSAMTESRRRWNPLPRLATTANIRHSLPSAVPSYGIK